LTLEAQGLISGSSLSLGQWPAGFREHLGEQILELIQFGLLFERSCDVCADAAGPSCAHGAARSGNKRWRQRNGNLGFCHTMHHTKDEDGVNDLRIAPFEAPSEK
jgi:hypothetical protein